MSLIGKQFISTRLLVIVAVFAVVSIIFVVGRSYAAPTIDWNPRSLSEEVAIETSKTVPVTFTASEAIKNATIRVVPALEPYVKVAPTTFSNIAKGQTVSLNVTFSAPQTAKVGTFNGTVQLRDKETLAKPLPVTIRVVSNVPEGWLNFVSVEDGYQIAYDPEFQLSELNSLRPEYIRGKIFTVPDDMPNVSINIYANSRRLPVKDWYILTLADKEYSFPDASTRVFTQTSVSGISSLQVRSEILGFIKLRTFVPVGDVVYGIETTVPDDAAIPASYFLMLQSFSVLN